MIHAFRFDAASNGVTYQSRFTGNATERAIQSVPKDQYRAIHISMRQRPESAFRRLMHAFGPLTKDPKLGDVPFNTSVTLEKLPTRGILNASTDANVIHKLDPETLRVTDRYDFSYFSPELDKSMCLSHGTLDDVTSEYFNCMANYGPVKTEYTVFRIDSSGKANVLAKVKDFTYYTHSLALTKSYVIMAMGPAQIDLFPLLRGKSFTEACEMRPNTPTRFVVINRQSGGIVAEYEHEQFFNFHTFNAFEQDGDIMIDRSLFSDCKILQELRIDNMTQGGNVARVKPVRFTLPNIADVGARYSTSVPKASFRVLADVALEFATVSPRKRERPYHYVFGVSDNDGKQFSSSIAKVNVDTGIVTSYVLPQRTFGEPIFVPDPSGNEEDASCLVVLALDNLKDSSALLVLDARTMTEVARAELPMRLPPSFHGAFHT